MKWLPSKKRRLTQSTALDAGVIKAALNLLPTPYDEDQLLRNAETFFGREIWTMPWAFPPDSEITGLWKATPTRDYIFISHRAAGVKRLYPLCHEIAHMLMGHQSLNTFAGQDALDEVLPRLKVAGRDLATLMILSLMKNSSPVQMRHAYNTSDERAAETLATTMVVAATEPPASPELGQITRALL